jgi:hypothetical protein
MRRVLLPVIGVIEIISGLAGIFFIVQALRGALPRILVPMLWYGIFPVACVVAGVMLLMKKRYGFLGSVVIQLLQVPFVQTGMLFLNLGAALSLTVKAYWAPRGLGSGLVLGINFLALGLLMVLFLCRPGATPHR